MIQIFASPKDREDGFHLDRGLPNPIAPTWGSLAPDASPDARYPAPSGDDKELVHTRIHEFSQSPVEWASFLSYSSVEESRCITPTRIYTLRKPAGWQAQRYGLQAWQSPADAQTRANILEHNWKIIYQSQDTKFMAQEFDRIGGSNPTNNRIISEKMQRLTATRFGVELYIQERE